jgi:diacylglycerol kinase (ATP)
LCIISRSAYPLPILRAAIINGPRPSHDWHRLVKEGVTADWSDELSAGLDAVVVIGGDGTVRRHLPRLAEIGVPVLVVPTGSGNDFASSLGIKNPRQALAIWKQFAERRDNVRTIDLGCATDFEGVRHLFCNVANFGMDSDINRRANDLTPFWRANGGYILSLFPSLMHYRAPEVRLCIDGRTMERKLLLAVAANATRYGRGLHIAPKADMHDGLLDVCFVREIPKLKVAVLFPLVYFGKHLIVKEVEYAKFRRLSVESSEPLEVYADGDFLCHTPAAITVVPNALQVIAP